MKQWIAILLLFTASQAWASVLPPQSWFTVTLADGSELDVRPATIRDVSDSIALAETRQGELVTEINGRWFNVNVDADGHWHAAAPLVTTGDSSDIPQTLTPVVQSSLRQLSTSSVPERTPFRYVAADYPAGFEQPLLVVRVSFSDQQGTYSDAEVAARFFSASDSVQSYFMENSYQSYRVVPAAENSGTAGDGIVHVTLPYAHPDFGNSYSGASQALARDVLSRVSNLVDLSAYDRNGDRWLDPNELGLILMVAGYEQAYSGAATAHPRVWAHKSTLYQGQAGSYYVGEYALFGEQHQTHLATIGILCHELGHLLLDLPDLYQAAGNGMGIGRWGLMGLGGWNRVSGYAGERPAHMLAWSKQLAGFIQPQSLSAGVSQVSLQAVSQSGDALEVFLDPYRHGERLMLEHRHQSGFDAGLPGSGVLVTRINDQAGYGSLSAASGDLRLLSVEEADGRDDLASNSNLGEASDVYSSGRNELLFAAEMPSDSTNELELLTVSAGYQADLELDLAAVPAGNNYGLDELPPNAVYGTYGGQARVRMELDGLSLRQLDGLDLFALGAGTVTFSVRVDGVVQVADASFSLSEGWNRLLLPTAVAVTSAPADVVIDVVVTAADLHAPLVVDAQGDASGKTYLVSNGQSEPAPFDVSARLLAVPEDVSASPDAGKSLQEVKISEVESGSSSGGGSIGWLLVILAPCLVLRRRLVI